MGTFDELRDADGYLQTLMKDETNTTTSKEETKVNVDEQDGSPKPEYKAKAAKDQDDKRRQLGDRTVYAYYFSTMGVPFLVLLFFLELGWGFLENFGSALLP